MSIKLDKSKLVRNLAAKTVLAHHLDRAIEAEEMIGFSFRFDGKAPDDAWHPSGDCTPSMRELFDKAMGLAPERKFSSGLLKTFMTGHFWHAYLQYVVVEKLGFAGAEDVERPGSKTWKWGEKIGDLTRPFQTIEDDGAQRVVFAQPWHYAKGSADICPCVIPDVGEFLIDFKTTNGYAYQNNNALPIDKWECQAAIYMDWHNIKRAVFLIIQKDSPHDFREVQFEANPELVESLYAKWALVGECVEEGVAPPADEDWPLPLRGPVNA